MKNKRALSLGLIGLLVVGMTVLLLGLAPTANAADIRSGERIVIPADQVIDDDLFVSGNEIIIDGTIKGDLYALGNTVTINGTVENDVMALAQTVLLNGKADALRVGAQNIVIGENANVAGTALLGAMNIETKPGSVIGRNLIFGAMQGLLAGNVGRDVLAGANAIELRGSIGRNMRVGVGDSTDAGMPSTFFMPTSNFPMPVVPAGLTIAASAKIGGDLNYEAVSQANIDPGAQISGAVSQVVPTRAERRQPTAAEIAQQQQEQTLNFWLDHLRRLIILLVFGLLALWIVPKWIQALAEKIHTKPLGSFGRGFLMILGFIVLVTAIVFVGIMLALLFGLLTFGDLAGLSVVTGVVAIGVLSFAYMVFTSYIAPIVVSLLIGRLIFDRMQGSWTQNRFLAFIVGLILLSLVALIPILNVIVGILVALFALGALMLWFASIRNPSTAPVLASA